MKQRPSCLAKAARTNRNFNKNTHRNRKETRKGWQPSENTFRCKHCHQMIYAAPHIGTQHRNHCPHCLWSLHVDTKPGNRASTCHGGMEPIALTFRHCGFDKYGRPRTGDVMLVHMCHGCGAINLNRIAGDDFVEEIFAIYKASLGMPTELKSKLETENIQLMEQSDLIRLNQAIFGKSHHGYRYATDP